MAPEPSNAATAGPVNPDAIRAIEAIVMVASEPVEPTLLAQLLELPIATIESLCAQLAASYREAGRGFELVKVAGGYRYQSHGDLAPYVERFVLEGQTAKLSGAALETLAIVAYKQPISRAQVASIRGVDPDGVLRTLQARGYVDQIGRDPGPGQALLWGTTPVFLEKLGLSSIDQLPPLAEYVPGADVVELLEQGLRVVPVVMPSSGSEPADDAHAFAPPTAPNDSAITDTPTGEEAAAVDTDAGDGTGDAVDAAEAPVLDE
jgi:segregation and condensation protein B